MTAARVHVRQLKLSGFRNYTGMALEFDQRHVVLVGDNGAGKTNLMEALSLLTPGRGLRRAPFSDLIRAGSGPENGFSVFANPAIIPPAVDITKIQGMPQSILFDMQDSNLFKKKMNSDIFILAGTEDDVVPTFWVLEFAKAQEATVRFLHDDHSFSANIEKLPNIIREIMDKKH